MLLELNRKHGTYDCTLGDLSIDGEWECFTLEDLVREGEKIPGETAIPAGRYKIIIDMSARFRRLMMHVLDVPNFSGIRIHAGNMPKDTEGCILVGQVKGVASISQSRPALSKLYDKVKDAIGRGEEVWLEIT